jgi:hypothetical protein
MSKKKSSENRGPVNGIGGAEKRIPPAGPALKVGEDGTQDASCAKSESQPPRSNVDQRIRTISLRHNRTFSGKGFMSRHKRKMEGQQ